MKELLDRVHPHNLEAESAVLSSILLSPATIDDVLALLQPSDLYDDANRIILETMIGIHESGKPVNMILLVDALKDAGDYERVGGAAYLARTLQCAATAAHVVHYSRIVREKSRRRKIIDAATIAIRDAYGEDETDAVLSTLTAELDGIDTQATGELVDSRTIARLAIDQYDARKAGQADTISTGLPTLDNILGGGFALTDYVVIGARTSFGKTALALFLLAYIARDMCRQSLLFSIEMSRAEIADRLVAAVGRLQTLKLRLGKLCPSDESKLVDTAGQLSQLSFRVDDSPGHTVASIARTARRESRRKPLSCIVVDYLQLLEPTKRADRRDMELAHMSRKFKALAQELRCPIICLAQLNKEANGVRPRMSHLREADSISHEANIVLLLDRPEFDKDRPDSEGEPCKLIIDKNRNGPRGLSVPLLWFAKYTQFAEPAPARHAAFDEFNN